MIVPPTAEANHKDADGSYKDGFTFTETVNDTDHTVTLTWENLYLEYGQDYFTPYFKWTTASLYLPVILAVAEIVSYDI